MGKYSLNKLPSDILKGIAFKIQALRKIEKISQQELAVKSGVSYGSIKRFEQTGKISFESLLKIIHVLGRLSDFEDILNPIKTKDIHNLFSSKSKA